MGAQWTVHWGLLGLPAYGSVWCLCALCLGFGRSGRVWVHGQVCVGVVVVCWPARAYGECCQVGVCSASTRGTAHSVVRCALACASWHASHRPGEGLLDPIRFCSATSCNRNKLVLDECVLTEAGACCVLSCRSLMWRSSLRMWSARQAYHVQQLLVAHPPHQACSHSLEQLPSSSRRRRGVQDPPRQHQREAC